MMVKITHSQIVWPLSFPDVSLLRTNSNWSAIRSLQILVAIRFHSICVCMRTVLCISCCCCVHCTPIHRCVIAVMRWTTQRERSVSVTFIRVFYLLVHRTNQISHSNNAQTHFYHRRIFTTKIQWWLYVIQRGNALYGERLTIFISFLFFFRFSFNLICFHCFNDIILSINFFICGKIL